MESILRYSTSHSKDDSSHVSSELHNNRVTLDKKKDDAGYDLAASMKLVIPPRGRALVPTRLRVALPKGYYGQIFPRSSLAVEGIDTSGGVIDAGYRGEIKIIVINATDKEYVVQPGQRIAQLVVIKLYEGEAVRVDDLDRTERGEKGFGSSGKYLLKEKSN